MRSTFSFFSNTSAPQPSEITTYGSSDSSDINPTIKKERWALRVNELICKITNMIVALAPQQSQLRDLSFLVWDKTTYNTLLTAHENQSCPHNDWPFALENGELENFLLSLNFDIRIYRNQPNMRFTLRNDLMLLSRMLSQVYMFTPAQCDSINAFQPEAWYKQFQDDLKSLVDKLESNNNDSQALQLFSENLTKLLEFLCQNIESFKSYKFWSIDLTPPREVLVNRLVLTAIQLKPFIEIGMQNKDYDTECNFLSSSKPASEEDDQIEEIQAPYNRNCSIM